MKRRVPKKRRKLFGDVELYALSIYNVDSCVALSASIRVSARVMLDGFTPNPLAISAADKPRSSAQRRAITAHIKQYLVVYGITLILSTPSKVVEPTMPVT